MYCPNCACELPAIAQFCVRCGVNTGFAPAGSGTQPGFPPSVSKQNAGEDHAFCGKCGAKALHGNQFCTKCGNALPANSAPAQTASSAQSILGAARIPVSPNIAQAEKPVQRSLNENQPEGENTASQDTPAQAKVKKRPVVTRDAWIVCSILSLLAAINNASKSGATGAAEFVPFAIGGFIGGLALFAGGWAIIVLVSRWLSGWISRLGHNHPNSHFANQQPPHLFPPSVKRSRLRAYWLVPLAVVALLSIWAFSNRDTHFVTGPAAPAETISRITVTGTLPDVVVLDGSNEGSNDRYRFEGHIHNDSSSEISFIRMRIRVYACGATPQPEDRPLTQEARSRCTEVGKSIREVYTHIGPGETGDFGNFYFPERPRNYGWGYEILRVETPSGG